MKTALLCCTLHSGKTTNVWLKFFTPKRLQKVKTGKIDKEGYTLMDEGRSSVLHLGDNRYFLRVTPEKGQLLRYTGLRTRGYHAVHLKLGEGSLYRVELLARTRASTSRTPCDIVMQPSAITRACLETTDRSLSWDEETIPYVKRPRSVNISDPRPTKKKKNNPPKPTRVIKHMVDGDNGDDSDATVSIDESESDSEQELEDDCGGKPDSAGEASTEVHAQQSAVPSNNIETSSVKEEAESFDLTSLLSPEMLKLMKELP